MKLDRTQQLAIAILAAIGALLAYLWRRQAAATDPNALGPAETPAPVTLSNVGTKIFEDDPADEIVATLLSGEITRRPYSLRYQNGGTDLYMRFVDDSEQDVVRDFEKRNIQIQ